MKKAISSGSAFALSIAAGALVASACGHAPAPSVQAAGGPPGSVASVASPSPGAASAVGSSSPPPPSAAAAMETGTPLATLFIQKKDPPGSSPDIIAVDHEKRRVWLRTDTETTSWISTFDIDAGKVVDTWRADPKRSFDRTGFKRLAFQALSGTQAEDLVRYAQIVAHTDERTLEVPAMSVSADRSKIAFLVKGGPRLQVAVADAEGKNVRLLGTPTMRGEHPSVSPDGRWLAFSACDRTATHNDCPRSLFVTDLRDPKLAVRKLPVAWPADVRWDADSAGLSTTERISLARASGVKDLHRSCLIHVDVGPGVATPIVCADDAYDTQLAVSPDRRWAALFVSRGAPPGRTFDMRICTLAKRTCAAPTPIPSLVGAAPRITNEGIVHAHALETETWSHRLDPREAHLVGDVDWPLGAERLDAKTLVRVMPTEEAHVLMILAGPAPVVKP